jgi:hypothetical protein
MAQWTETLEPYVKVQEEVRAATLNPTTGEDLIIGCVIFADAGPSTPTLISGQKEFRSVFASQNITEDYINSLNALYDCKDGGDPTLPALMWSNAYRLAGSNTLLVVRAGKSRGVNFVKSAEKSDYNTYLVKDGVILKKINPFKIVVDFDGDSAVHTTDGWSMNIEGIGIVGNRVTDEGPQYDIAVNNLPELVKVLNDSSVFFSPSYKFYSDVEATDANEVPATSSNIKSVKFEEAYTASSIIDTTDERCPNGVCYLVFCEPDWSEPSQSVITEYLQDKVNNAGALNVIDPNSLNNFEVPNYYAINKYNSASDLRVRIRRFNHDAVVPNNLGTLTELTSTGQSSVTPIKEVLDTFTKGGNNEVTSQVKERDFFEIAIYDPSLSGEVLFFNVGNIAGRGDITVDELQKQMSMIEFNLPKDLHELGINYSNYSSDNATWMRIDVLPSGKSTADITKSSMEELYQVTDEVKATFVVGSTVANVNGTYYLYVTNGEDQIYCDLKIDPTQYMILKANDTDLLDAVDLLEQDEVYVTEGLTDLGNTTPSFQSYLANLAINSNYFYPISTVRSTNYLTIGNSISKLSQNSCKLYASAPWDLDSSTLGWEYYVSNSVLYWESVARNRRNNEEFRGLFGQGGGLVQYQSPVCEFNKKTRQLLLTKKVNTAVWDIQANSWIMNDNYTKQTENNILSDDGNARLQIRISKSCPVLLKQFIGRKITDKLCNDIREVIDYFFKTVILAYRYSVDDYQIFCDYDEALARQNKVNVVINVRYQRSLKYINVLNRAFDVGMDISSAE